MTPATAPSPERRSLKQRTALVLAALSEQKPRDCITVLKDSLTIMALIVGAAWTVWTVAKYRDHYPIVATEVRVSHKDLPHEKVLLTVDFDVRNAGKVLLRPLLTRVSIYRVLPMAEPELTKLMQGTLAPDSRRDVDWPRIDSKEDRNTDRQLEPGETEPFHYEFIVPKGLELVAVYAFVQNPKLSTQDKPVGWQRLRIYDLRTNQIPTAPDQR